MAELLLHDADGLRPGELEVVKLLETALPEDWVVIANLVVPSNQDARELDVVVLGDGYIHVLEVKHHSGRIVIDGTGMTRDGWPVGNPFQQVNGATNALRGWLDKQVPELAGVRYKVATSRVVLSNPLARVAVSSDREESVSHIDDLVADLRRRDRSATEVRRLRHKLRRPLESANARDAMPERLLGYRVVERLSNTRSRLTFLGHHFQDDSAWILRILRVRQTLDPEVGVRERAALLLEYEALRALAPLGVAPEVERPQELEDGRFLVAIAALEGQCLLDHVRRDHRPDGEEVRRVVHAAFRALAVVHEKGHVHRALTPERIWIGSDGSVRFSDFHLAHVDTRTGLSSVLDDLDPTDEDQRYWRAPEARHSILGALPESDVWALATSLRSWVLGETRSKPLKKHTLPGEARARLGDNADDFIELLRSCRLDASFERPCAADVADRWSDEPASAPQALDAEPDAPTLPLFKRDLSPGDEIDDRYVFIERLGAGASAVTFLVKDRQTERLAVLKSINFDDVPIELAKREFEALVDLHHDRIAVVRYLFPPSHGYHLVIDHAPGMPASRCLDDFQGEGQTVARIACSLLQGLGYLHEREVLHRDISAGNVILGAEDPADLKIIDFGLATIEQELSGSCGTPLYRAPEVERGGRWTPACDTYSAGVLLHQLLTGELPYQLRNGCLDKARPAPVPPDLDGFTQALLDLLRTATAFDPDARFPDASEFLAAIEDLLREGPPEAVQATAADEPIEAGPFEETTFDNLVRDLVDLDKLDLADSLVSDRDVADVLPESVDISCLPPLAPDETSFDELYTHVDDAFAAPLVEPAPMAPEQADVLAPAEPVNHVLSIPAEPFHEAGLISIDTRELAKETEAIWDVSVLTGTCTFHPAAQIGPYPGNTWLTPGRLRRYTVGRDHTIRATVVSAGGERTVLADPVPGLVEGVNACKEFAGQPPGGSFVINVHGDVLVPTGEGVVYGGWLDGLLTFRGGGQALSPQPAPTLRIGELWDGLLVGCRYRLKAGCDDIEYEDSYGRATRLSSAIGKDGALEVASAFGRTKRGGGRLYVNEAGAVLAPVQRGYSWVDTYVGRVDPDRWFPAPLG
jgi:serine/threonine protein kinase